jgi:hypothetical protein
MTVKDMFTREHLQSLADAIQKMVTRTDETGKYGLKLHHSSVKKNFNGYYSKTIQDEKWKT